MARVPPLTSPAQPAAGAANGARPPCREPEDDDILSLRSQLMNWLFTPLYLLLLFSTITGYIAALKLSNQPYDLVLIERARLMVGRYDLASGAGPGAAELLPAGAGNLAFTLFGRDDRPLVANASLPRPRPSDWESHEPRLRDTAIKGRKVRLLTLRYRSLRRSPGAEYLLVLAEPVSDRLSLGRNILGNIVIPQFIFILIAALAVWIGLKRGLGPLEQLRLALVRRPPDDLSALDESQAPGEVRPLIREVNALIDRLKDMMAQQKRFVANAAHQLRTPFAGLRAQAELGKRQGAPADVQAALERISAGADRCSHLVNQLLTLARNEPDARENDLPRPLDLERLVQESAMHWAPEAMRKGIDLGFAGSGRSLPLRGSEAALRDLIDNLVDNAIRYTPAGGHITVRTGYDSGAWLQVEDSGPGIPPAERSRVFDRFYRVAGSAQPGSGLGLAIVREVAQRHCAEVIIADAAAGTGAVFTVRFPRRGV